MKPITIFSISIAVLFLVGCFSQTRIAYVSEDRREPWNHKSGYVVIPEKEKHMEIDGSFLCIIEDGYPVRSMICGYDAVLDRVKKHAFAFGGNVIKILEVKAPEKNSGCYFISAAIYYVEDFMKYETHIYWSEERQLTIADFKDSFVDRPYPTRGSHSIRYKLLDHQRRNFSLIQIDLSFICKYSYFDPLKADEFSLAQEQLLFDIAEKYGRLMVIKLQESDVVTLDLFKTNGHTIISDMSKLWDKERDRCLAEIQSDSGSFAVWRQKIDNDLLSTKKYYLKSLLLKD